MTRLITIHFSHYCDKARWGLDHSGVPFVEEAHFPGTSGMAARMAGGRRSVPVLVDGETVLTQSADIVRWADARAAKPSLFPDREQSEIASLCGLFDEELGPATRRVAYDRVLRLPTDELGEIFSFGVRAPWEADLGRTLAFAIAALIRRGLRVTPAGVERARATLDRVFGVVEDRLKDGRPYLAGDAFTAADLTFAALSAPVVAPDSYRRFFPPRTLDVVLEPVVTAYRARRAGRHALRMYDEHRG